MKRPAGVNIGPSQITGNLFTTNATGQSISNVDNWGSSLNGEWRGDQVTIRSITAYRELSAIFARDNDNTPLPYFEVTNRDKQHQISQEFQVAGNGLDERLTYLVRLYYFHELTRDNSRVRVGEGLFPVIGLDLGRIDSNLIRTTSYAIFGEGSYKILGNLSLTLGGRYNHDHKQYDVLDVRPFSDAFIVPATTVINSWSSFTPRVSLDWRPVGDDMLFYGPVSHGFKAGGFNGRPDAAIGVTPYQPEKITSPSRCFSPNAPAPASAILMPDSPGRYARRRCSMRGRGSDGAVRALRPARRA